MILATTGARAELRIEALDPPLPLTIVGWFAFDPNSSEDLDTTGIAFSNALYDGYRDLSKARRAGPDPKDGEHFNHKARTAARRSSVLPDWPSDRDLSEEDRSVFHSALQFMNAAFERGGREVAPQNAATAQVSYDCWIEATEYAREDDVNRCRQAFWDAMNASSGEWYVFAPEQMPPKTPASNAEFTGALAAATSDLVKAERNLQRTYITLPYTGMVRAKEADIGQYTL